MALRLVQFLAIMLTALAFVPSGAHLAALPNKMAMAQAAYFVTQQIYAGWALFGIVLFGALVANLAHAVVLSKLGGSFGYALASFLLIAANLAIFFVWTFPTNQATNNWTVGPCASSRALGWSLGCRKSSKVKQSFRLQSSQAFRYLLDKKRGAPNLWA